MANQDCSIRRDRRDNLKFKWEPTPTFWDLECSLPGVTGMIVRDEDGYRPMVWLNESNDPATSKIFDHTYSISDAREIVETYIRQYGQVS